MYVAFEDHDGTCALQPAEHDRPPIPRRSEHADETAASSSVSQLAGNTG
jgi:hypothetical protein